VSAQDNPPKIEELYERLQRAEAAARRAGRVDCTSNSFLSDVGLCPLVVS